MSKHTPGPWELHKRCETAVVGSTGFIVAACGGYASTSRDTEQLHAELCANARLIAAAPALYEALKGIVALWDHHASAHGDGVISSLHDQARAALALVERAEGGEK